MWNKETSYCGTLNATMPSPCDEFPGIPPEWDTWMQGNPYKWLRNHFFPYWRRLTSQQVDAYLAEWPIQSDREAWHNLLRRMHIEKPISLFDFTFAPEPPWICYPESGDEWEDLMLWREGRKGCLWLHDIFLPFWDRLTTEQRGQYLMQWPPPENKFASIQAWSDLAKGWKNHPYIPPDPPFDFTNAPEPLLNDDLIDTLQNRCKYFAKPLPKKHVVYF
jgi:hypothetical protein